MSNTTHQVLLRAAAKGDSESLLGLLRSVADKATVPEMPVEVAAAINEQEQQAQEHVVEAADDEEEKPHQDEDVKPLPVEEETTKEEAAAVDNNEEPAEETIEQREQTPQEEQEAPVADVESASAGAVAEEPAQGDELTAVPPTQDDEIPEVAATEEVVEEKNEDAVAEQNEEEEPAPAAPSAEADETVDAASNVEVPSPQGITTHPIVDAYAALLFLEAAATLRDAPAEAEEAEEMNEPISAEEKNVDEEPEQQQATTEDAPKPEEPDNEQADTTATAEEQQQGAPASSVDAEETDVATKPEEPEQQPAATEEGVESSKEGAEVEAQPQEQEEAPAKDDEEQQQDATADTPAAPAVEEIEKMEDEAQDSKENNTDDEPVVPSASASAAVLPKTIEVLGKQYTEQACYIEALLRGGHHSEPAQYMTSAALDYLVATYPDLEVLALHPNPEKEDHSTNDDKRDLAGIAFFQHITGADVVAAAAKLKKLKHLSFVGIDTVVIEEDTNTLNNGLETLNFSGCHGIADETLEKLLLPVAETLQTLVLDGATAITGTALVTALPSLKALNTLDLSNLLIKDDVLQAITEESNTTLKHVLLLNCVQLTNAGVESLVNATGNQLEYLNISGCTGLGDEALKHLEKCTVLNTLKLWFVDQQFSGVEAYQQLLPLAATLEVLALNAGLTDEVLATVVSALTQLKVLSIPSNGAGISPKGLKALSSLNGLVSLNLCDNISTDMDDLVAAVAAAAPQLESLFLSHCPHLTDAGILSLSSGLPALRCLDVRGNLKLTSDGVKFLASLNALRSVNLTGCTEIAGHGQWMGPQMIAARIKNATKTASASPVRDDSEAIEQQEETEEQESEEARKQRELEAAKVAYYDEVLAARCAALKADLSPLLEQRGLIDLAAKKNQEEDEEGQKEEENKLQPQQLAGLRQSSWNESLVITGNKMERVAALALHYALVKGDIATVTILAALYPTEANYTSHQSFFQVPAPGRGFSISVDGILMSHTDECRAALKDAIAAGTLWGKLTTIEEHEKALGDEEKISSLEAATALAGLLQILYPKANLDAFTARLPKVPAEPEVMDDEMNVNDDDNVETPAANDEQPPAENDETTEVPQNEVNEDSVPQATEEEAQQPPSNSDDADQQEKPEAEEKPNEDPAPENAEVEKQEEEPSAAERQDHTVEEQEANSSTAEPAEPAEAVTVANNEQQQDDTVAETPAPTEE